MALSSPGPLNSLISGGLVLVKSGSIVWRKIDGLSPAIVFGHADADGHLAAQQSRENLEAREIEVRRVVVSPETANYRFWERSFSEQNFAEFELVVVVDIAFKFKNPAESLRAVLRVVDNHLNTHFVIIDHHALSHPERSRPNLSLVETDSAFDCCLGAPSDELMVVAAICDGDGDAVRSQTSDTHRKRADGVRRAAADVGGVAGSKLIKLLELREWAFFESLADEAADFHKRARGRRTSKSLASPLLEAANRGTV